jgi:DNA polymerase
MTVWVDFETASECDLKTAGVYNYARHPSTRVLCMAYAVDDDEVQVWTPDQPFPRHILTHQIRAHNAAFERLIFWHVLNMPFLDNFYCTAAQARASCAPGSLEDVGRFAGSEMRKDHRGAYLVRQCCVPPFREDLLPELFEYCAQDVRTMRAVSKAMRELTAEELEDYHVNERINDRGVH